MPFGPTGRLAASVGGGETFLHRFHRNVVDMALFSEDVIGRVAGIAEQIGDVTVGPSERQGVNDGCLHIWIAVILSDRCREVETIHAALRDDLLQDVFSEFQAAARRSALEPHFRARKAEPSGGPQRGKLNLIVCML